MMTGAEDRLIGVPRASPYRRPSEHEAGCLMNCVMNVGYYSSTQLYQNLMYYVDCETARTARLRTLASTGIRACDLSFMFASERTFVRVSPRHIFGQLPTAGDDPRGQRTISGWFAE